MAWGPDTVAGFTLAALLSDDRDLAYVSDAVAPDLVRAVHARLDGMLARPDSSQNREDGVRALLAVLRPELDASALSLPARVHGLLARLAAPKLQKLLRADSAPTRADFNLDEDLLSALARIARSAKAREVL